MNMQGGQAGPAPRQGPLGPTTLPPGALLFAQDERPTRIWQRRWAACLALAACSGLGLAAEPPRGAGSTSQAQLGTASTEAAGLYELIREAQASHPLLRARQAAGAAAQAEVTRAQWQFYPTPNLSLERVQAGGQDPSYSGGKQVATVGLSQPLWTGGRLTAGLGRAQAQLLISEASLAEAREQLALRTIQAFGEALGAQLKATALGRSREVHAQLLARVERRIAEGVSAQADGVLAQSRLLSVEADIAALAMQRAQALERLRQLVGRPVQRVDATEPAAIAGFLSGAGVGHDGEVERLVAAAQQASPAHARVLAGVQVAEREVELAEASQKPELYLRMEHQRGGYSQSGSGGHTRVFVGLSSRFGAGLSGQSDVQGAQARRDAAGEELQAQRRAIEEQVRIDHALQRSAQARQAFLARSLAAAGDVSESWDRQFLGGRKQWQDVMNAAREQAQTDAQLAEASVAAQMARWRLALQCRGIHALLGEPAAPVPAPGPVGVPQSDQP